ncbi:MAG: hypothetical protein ABI576_06030 [Flavobacterium sp.]
MENNKIRNYDQNDPNHQDIPHTNLEKSELNKDLNEKPENEEGFEEFTSDQPNRFNEEDRNVNTPNSENDHLIRAKSYLDLDEENYYNVYQRNPFQSDRDL